ncbi:hypothetical protein [Motilimonas eburnea]|uniref:hypothetical protein n=1 Tax=Motilimonas eburnea TaxID=1737488 RepID=UPI001E60A0A8|nr:hypothetical protein [Motilimonas eburnea]MCE2571817.1 hypothetical protein [Motilimonas eburnea]
MKETTKKYKHTRQLLKIAKQEGGYTNKDIEKKAGLQGSSSSLASRWLNGHALATERQMRYFINNYGQHLKRQLEHLFIQSLVDEHGVEQKKYMKFTGDIIFKHQIKLKLITPFHGRYKTASVVRVIILENQGTFKILLQCRAGFLRLSTMDQTNFQENTFAPTRFSAINGETRNLEWSDIEEANWHCIQVTDCASINTLVKDFTALTSSLADGNNIFDYILDPESAKTKSKLFNKHIPNTMEFAFYQKIMKLGLQSELLPF